MNTINKDKSKIYIYGAGDYASILFSYFKIINVEISGFVVTEKNNQVSQLFGKEVYTIKDVTYRPQDLFYIAMREDYAKQVVRTLDEYNISNYVIMDHIMMTQIQSAFLNFYESQPIQNNKIVVQCYGGKGYCCNPKYIVQELEQRKYPIVVVWAVTDSEDHTIPSFVRKVKVDSPEYFEEIMTAKVIITNDALLPFNIKRKNQIVVNTWHGAGPFKRCGYDGDNEVFAQTTGLISTLTDLFLSASQFNTKFYKTAFHYEGAVLESGAPRNDILFHESNIREKICKRYSIPIGKKIVLYAPTFRGSALKESFEHYNIGLDKVLDALQEKFNTEFVCMGRYHYLVSKYIEMRDFGQSVIDVSDYIDAQELLVAADVLISDYSSIIWDFSLQKKLVLLYHNDITEYEKERGFYSSPQSWPYLIGHNTEELCSKIRMLNMEEYESDLEDFFVKYGRLDDGSATKRVVDKIAEIMRLKDHE